MVKFSSYSVGLLRGASDCPSDGLTQLLHVASMTSFLLSEKPSIESAGRTVRTDQHPICVPHLDAEHKVSIWLDGDNDPLEVQGSLCCRQVLRQTLS
jgi:hypothetical protein